MIVRQTLRHPDVLESDRRDKKSSPRPPLTHEELAEIEKTSQPCWDELLGAVHTVLPGRESASAYEKAVEGLLSALFYPSLANPSVQHEIHDGRKRIDITYTNLAREGFFGWLGQHYPAAHVFVECKNYGREVGNPELDQLSGRFSPSRGMFGLLVCRGFEDKELFIKRCIDTAHDRRGYIIPLDDNDLRELVQARRAHEGFGDLPLLRSLFNRLVM